LQSPDADLLKITEALQEVLETAQSRFPSTIPLELYVSSNFMGLFVPSDVTEFLRGVGADYFKAIGQKRRKFFA
jgi:ubiquitin-associated SH3 domain-containing protein